MKAFITSSSVEIHQLLSQALSILERTSLHADKDIAKLVYTGSLQLLSLLRLLAFNSMPSQHEQVSKVATLQTGMT